MTIEEQNRWLRHEDITQFIESNNLHSPWFHAYRVIKSEGSTISWFSAFVPVELVPGLLKNSGGWDLHIGDGAPAVWTGYSDGKKTYTYTPFGRDDGIEPLVFHRSFHGIRKDHIELSQEFRLFHNLYNDQAKNRFLQIDNNGDEHEVARYGSGFLEVQAELVRKFCSVKQMAIAIYVDGFRNSKNTLAELGISETRKDEIGATFEYSISVLSNRHLFDETYNTTGGIIGKKYVMPDKMPTDDDADEEHYQDFIIATDSSGNLIRHTCNPEKLANYFGKNPNSPHYLTPVFFRAEVLTKYYSDPTKYTVQDGYLRCGSLWGLRVDNDHDDIVVVFLGDLGRDLAESERVYWLSFNISPLGRKISRTNFQRGFLGEFADPQRPDLVFKSRFESFNTTFLKAKGWSFFLPLHQDDEHFLTGLRVLTKDNQAEFDQQLLGLTKILVDSINEAALAKETPTLSQNDKGITKLEKFFLRLGAVGYEKHIKFLRVLQNLRSTSAAHRKGSKYEDLITDLQIADEGQQKVFSALLINSVNFLEFLKTLLIP